MTATGQNGRNTVCKAQAAPQSSSLVSNELPRARIIVFAGFCATIAIALFVLRFTAEDWARDFYRPVLTDRIVKARQELQLGSIEPALIQAVRATPPYAEDVLDRVSDGLAVMPELSAELVKVFSNQRAENGRLNARRVEFARGTCGMECMRPTSSDVDEWQICLLDRLSCDLARNSFWMMPTPVPNVELAELVPELRRELALYWQARRDAIETGPEPSSLYLGGIAAMRFGDLESARGLLEKAMGYESFEADAAYRIGAILDSTGRSAEALRYFERALGASENHADAAAAFMRCYERQSGDAGL
jgi:tetratricopeptide (TPR) repeat protein